jgi:hypothetical protein
VQKGRQQSAQQNRLRFAGKERLPKGDPKDPFQISDRTDHFLAIHEFVKSNRDDPAIGPVRTRAARDMM